ncbi:hypothetical protein [Faecalimonas sp.]
MSKKKIRIIKKNDEFSMEYQIGDVFEIDSTWYGGVNVRGVSGIPVSLDQDEYEEVSERESRPIDEYSYRLGAIDCLCEMVAEGEKNHAVSRKFDTKEERDYSEEEVKKICEKYGVLYKKKEEHFYMFFIDEKN